MERRVFIRNSVLSMVYASLATNILSSCSDKSFSLKKNQKIGCIGDSVTYSGGNGYAELLQKLVDEKYPEYNLEFINLGLNSETITGLTEYNHPGPRPYLFDRLHSILDKADIDVAFFCYGINCGIYGEPSEELFDRYRKGVEKFLDSMQKENIEVVMLTPPPLALKVAKKNGNTKLEVSDKKYSWLTPYENYDVEVIQEFKKIVLETDHPSIVKKIDVHSLLSKNKDQAYGWDPIHPNAYGNTLIAEALLETLF